MDLQKVMDEIGINEMTDEEFDQFLEQTYKELESKQNALFEKYDLDAYDEWEFDREGGIIGLRSSRNGGILGFETIPIGVWLKKKNLFQWAWANPDLSEMLQVKCTAIQGLTNWTGYGVFTDPEVPANEGMVYAFASLAVFYLNSMGLYVVGDKKKEMFLAVMSEVK